MEALDTLFGKLSLLVLTVVERYGRLTNARHPLLTIVVLVGIFAGIDHLARAGLFKGWPSRWQAFSAGGSPHPYIPAFNGSLFLTANERGAIDAS